MNRHKTVMSCFPGAALLTLAFVLLWSPARAQTDGGRIPALVKEGQKVVITDDQGRVVSGRISSIRADGLELLADGETTDVRYPNVVRIDHPPDRLWNGALTGFGVGAGLGVLVVASDDCSSFFGCPEAVDYLAGSVLIGGIGSAIGTVIDALIRQDREIYRRRPRATLAPVVAPGLKAALVSVWW
jgi:hypothetical protein